MFFFISFSIMAYHRILNTVPVCSRTLLFLQPIHDSLHLLNPPTPLSAHRSLTTPWQPQVCSLCLWVCFCFIDMFICVVF